MSLIRLIAFDLDGTLSEHKRPLEDENRHLLEELSDKYKIIMVASNEVDSIWEQLNRFPIDIVGNYGMQYSEYDEKINGLRAVFSHTYPCDTQKVRQTIQKIQEKYGYPFGNNLKIHSSGCITYTPLGTDASLENKLSFDPDFSKRRKMLPDVVSAFPDYTPYISGTTSFDIVPKPFNKYMALDLYCKSFGYSHGEVLFCGDNYEPDCNDSPIYQSDIKFVKVPHYTKLKEVLYEVLDNSANGK